MAVCHRATEYKNSHLWPSWYVMFSVKYPTFQAWVVSETTRVAVFMKPKNKCRWLGVRGWGPAPLKWSSGGSWSLVHPHLEGFPTCGPWSNHLLSWQRNGLWPQKMQKTQFLPFVMMTTTNEELYRLLGFTFCGGREVSVEGKGLLSHMFWSFYNVINEIQISISIYFSNTLVINTLRRMVFPGIFKGDLVELALSEELLG